MSFLSTWVLSIVGVVILGVLVDIIISDGQMSKYIKSIFAVFSMLIIASPIPKLLNNEISFEDVFESDSSIVIDENYLNYLYQIKMQSVKDECIKIIKNLGYEVVQIDIDSEMKQQEIFIKSIKIVINIDKPHIDIIDKIQTEIQKAVTVDSDKVVIYGKQTA